MKRLGIGIEEIVDLGNLAQAFRRAAKGSPRAREVEIWRGRLDDELAAMRRDILRERLAIGQFQRFRIRDPKPRMIHAPCFRERVLHHAVIAKVGPVLDRALIDDTYACRVGKGAHAAVSRVQQHLRKYRAYVQIDIRGYFASIQHDRLKALLRRRIKGDRVLRLLDAIVDCYADPVGRGLPIGALTSQHFANFYLNGADRFLLEELQAFGMVRYMDDIAWWCDSEATARSGLERIREYLRSNLALEIKPTLRIARSDQGIRFCGFRVFPGTIQLSRRRMRRYAAARRRWESAYGLGLIDECTLQQGYASACAITAHADAIGFRRQQLQRVPVRFEC